MSLPRLPLRQLRCVWAAFFIFISGGMKMAQNPMKLFDSNENHSIWFYLAMVGSLLGPLFGTCVPYKYSYMISSGFVIIGGILCITDIVASDCLNGMAFGMTMVTAISAGSENIRPSYRGRILSIQVIGVSIGMLIYCVVFPFYAVHNDNNLVWFKVFGFISIGCGLLAFISSFYANNSPIHYLTNKGPQLAIHAVQKLYGEKSSRNPSQNVLKKFSEIDKYVRHEASTYGFVSFGFDLLAAVKLLVMRILMAVATASCVIMFFNEKSRNEKEFRIAVFFFGSARVFGAVFFAFFIDWIGRKKVSMASFFGLGILFIALGVLLETKDKTIALMVIPAIGQFFSGLGEGVTTIYMSEAFSLRAKSVMICILIGLESVSMILLNKFRIVHQMYALTLGVLCLVGVALVFIFLPETKRTSLAEARRRFNSVLSIKF